MTLSGIRGHFMIMRRLHIIVWKILRWFCFQILHYAKNFMLKILTTQIYIKYICGNQVLYVSKILESITFGVLKLVNSEWRVALQCNRNTWSSAKDVILVSQIPAILCSLFTHFSSCSFIKAGRAITEQNKLLPLKLL